MLSKRTIIVFSVLLLLALSALNSISPELKTQGQAGTISPKGVLRLALVGQPTSLNQLTAPSDCKSCWQIIDLEYGFGMPLLQNGSAYPQAGLFDWMNTSSTANVWEFNIRPGATWSDGIPINSSDVLFTFGLAKNVSGLGYLIGTPYDFFGLADEIVSVTAVNSSLTKFILNQDDANFGIALGSQSYFTIVPEHIWNGTISYGANPNFGQDVTSGPFYHKAYREGSSSMTLVANSYYNDGRGPGLAQINVTFVSSESQAVSELLSGQVDLAEVNATSVSQFLSNSHFGVNIESERGLSYLEFNDSIYPFDLYNASLNSSFRWALMDAINTYGIAQSVYNNYATPGAIAEGGIPPSATMWHNQSVTKYSYNLALAKGNLTKLGFTYQGTNLYYPSPNSSRVSLKIYTDTNNSADYEVAQQVANDLGPVSGLGINVQVVPESLSNISNSYTNNIGDIRNEMVVASSTTSLFGVGFLDAVPAYDWYFPWFLPQEHWLEPLSADQIYNATLRQVFYSPTISQVQQAVRNIDGLNSYYLPVIVLAYPDGIWAYSNANATGFPPTGPSIIGFDMGDESLDPYTFGQITGTGTNTQTLTTPAHSTTSTTSTTPTVSHLLPGSNFLLVLSLAVVIIVIFGATLFFRRRRRRMSSPPPPPPPTASS